MVDYAATQAAKTGIPTTKNGAIILQRKVARNYNGYVVLCFLPGNGGSPFVTWWMRDDGETFAGDYHIDLEKALKSYKERS